MSLRLQRAELISFIVIAGFFLSVCFHYVMHFYLHRPYPYSTFLSFPTDRLSDYGRVADAAKSGDPYRYRIPQFHGPGGEVGNYLPFTYMVAMLFSIGHHGVFVFLSLFLAGLAWHLYHQTGIRTDPQITSLAKLRIVFVLTLMSYPVLWELDRGNFEALTFLLMAAGAALIGTGRYSLGAVPLALAIAMKGYPAIFLALYLPVRKYREAALCVIIAVVVCLVGFSVWQGGLMQSIHSFRADLAFFLDYYVFKGAGAAGARMDCSPFAVLGLLNSNPNFIRHALPYYNGLALLAGVLLLWLVLARKMERWKLEYLLAAAGLLLTPVSYDYKLLVLFIPLASFLGSARREHADAFFCASFGVMLIPKDYLFIGNSVSIANGVSISSLIEPLVLLATVALIVREVLTRPAADRDVPAEVEPVGTRGRQLSR